MHRNSIIMKTKKKGKKKGFTLIELLVVIAIIAILSVVVVLTLNPAEMLRRSRDSNRASDLSVIKTAIGLYLADVSTTAMGTANTCYVAYPGGTAPTSWAEFPNTGVGSEASNTSQYTVGNSGACTQWFANSAAASAVVSSSRSVNGSGWIPINLTLVSSGAPIGQWPADPSYSSGTAVAAGNSNAAHFYAYIGTSTNNGYKLAAKMESALYSASGTNDLEWTDGGIDPFMYEQGTNLAL